MAIWQAALLGVLQGLTEFLPVSSSGHLVLGKAILGIEIYDIAFEVVVHFGTLLAVLTIFKDDILLLLKGLKSLVLFKSKNEESDDESDDESSKGLKLLGLLIIGTLPAAIIGFIFSDTFEAAFSNPLIVCGTLIVTGIILFASKFASEKGAEVSPLKAFWIGLAQVAALFPGISRSGTTITAAMITGIKREEAVRFSFLLAIPLILAVTILQVFEFISQLPSGRELVNLLIGTVFAYLSGVFAIKWLLAFVKKGWFDRFAYYCFAVGVTGLVLLSI